MIKTVRSGGYYFAAPVTLDGAASSEALASRQHRDDVALTIVVAMGLGFALQHVVDVGLEYIGFSRDKTHRITVSDFMRLYFRPRSSSLVEVLDAVPNAERPAHHYCAAAPAGSDRSSRAHPFRDSSTPIDPNAVGPAPPDRTAVCHASRRSLLPRSQQRQIDRGTGADPAETGCVSRCRSATAIGYCSRRMSSRRR